MKQIPLALAFEAERTFESFVPGANTMALEHLLTVQPGAAPVYLWGPAGSGKTHLLSALSLRLQQQGGQVGWFGAATPAPWPAEEGRSLIVLDGCDALDADPGNGRRRSFAAAEQPGADHDDNDADNPFSYQVQNALLAAM